MQSIEELLKQTVQSIKSSAEANEIVGKPIYTQDGSVILPISKLSIGFVVGSSDIENGKNNKYPTGISGGGMSVVPIGFLVCGAQKKFVKVDGEDNKWLELFKSVVGVVKD